MVNSVLISGDTTPTQDVDMVDTETVEAARDTPDPNVAEATTTPATTTPAPTTTTGTTAGAPDAQTDKPAEEVKEETNGTYTFTFKNFSKIKDKKHFGETFEILGMKWNILMFPNGNDVDQLSLYLNVPEAKTLPIGWSRNCQFSMEVISATDPKQNQRREATHRFTDHEVDWGFTQFMKLSLLRDPRMQYLKDDCLTILVEVSKMPEPTYLSSYSYWNYDSKKETGHVGLRNQGATCYMNSLLQAFFHVGAFRKAVYLLPTDQDLPTKSIPLALQRIFYRLQFGDQSVATKELTKSFGWTAVDSFTQHDVQELNRVLCDNLQGKMKGTKVEGTIERLLQGKTKNFIKCINVPYESTRTEEFFDLSLNVKGSRSVIDSFERYVETEMLDGDNKYHAEGHGLQDAKKGIMFMSLPPVLHLQLMRFEYDPMKDAMVKINDKYEFPDKIDLAKFMAEEADKSVSTVYHLHGVLVHSGDVHGGHYYAFIKPTGKTEWFKFDDERVTKATTDQVFKDNFGGDDEYNYKFNGRMIHSVHKRSANAYMLVYYRESELADLLYVPTDADIPEHLKAKFASEAAEEEVKKKDKLEAHLYTTVRVATEQDLRNWRKLDLVRFEGAGVREFRVKKTSTLRDLRKTLSETLQIAPDRMRFWYWVNRQNKTVRADVVVPPEDEEKKFDDLIKSDTRIFVETSTLPPNAPPETPPFSNLVPRPVGGSTGGSGGGGGAGAGAVADEDLLLFFKYYDPEKETLRLLGHTYAKQTHKAADLIPIANRMLGFPMSTVLVPFEEIKPTMVEPLKWQVTLKENEITTGDVIVFQRPPNVALQLAFPTVPDFYDYVLSRVTVKFRRLDKPKVNVFSLELSKKMLYDQVVKKVADKLATDPAKIRLTGHNGFYDQPKPSAIKRNERMTLSDMLALYYQPASGNTISDTLFFEALELPVAEYENKKVLKITWHNLKTEAVDNLQLLVPKDATVGFIMTELQKLPSVKLEGGPAGSGRIRLAEVWNAKFNKILREDESVSLLSDFSRLHAEEIPLEEYDLAPEDYTHRLVQVSHYNKETYISQSIHNHGHPFFMVIAKSETMKQVKERILKRLGLTEEETAKWKYALVTFGRPDYLQDDDVVLSRDWTGSDYLGLEHPDMAARAHYRHIPEKPIKIYG
eukprot:TRINITY_DN935_c0_g1_i1.p1 TRINITY_DN935_c0_g1~~TRINITY_DN935_c0_g1_i1.p1  ORF type:complete len:1154 (-),score=430.34 TRINITY_DN935_c0_g1_i1:57-3518(-)